jgi:two-component system, LytTR family, response regulator
MTARHKEEGQTLRIVIADDERPARNFLRSLLQSHDAVDIVGEAASGMEAVRVIEAEQPDLALLDLQMPEVDGLEVVRLLRHDRTPLIAFVTAYDMYAVRAFELNAIDYLLKPVEPARLWRTIARAQERLERADFAASAEVDRVRAAAAAYDRSISAGGPFLRRIPVRRRDDIVILGIDDIASIVAEGQNLHLTTLQSERYTITYRLKDIEARLDPAQFVRLSRGSIVNLDTIRRVSPMPGGTYLVTLNNKQQVSVSRLRARALRDNLFKL